MSERDRVLGRIRQSLRDVPAGEPAHWDPESDGDPSAAYARAADASGPSLVETFGERCSEYRASVTRCGGDAASIAKTVTSVCSRQAATSVVVPADLDPGWVTDELQIVRDEPALDLPSLDRCDGALTACALAIAATGTIVLDAGPGQGRRALSLVPDLHVCVVRAGQIVSGVPQAIDRLAEAVTDGRPITFISGPSATSDIELRRVEGVHGPRRLEVVLAL